MNLSHERIITFRLIIYHHYCNVLDQGYLWVEYATRQLPCQAPFLVQPCLPCFLSPFDAARDAPAVWYGLWRAVVDRIIYVRWVWPEHDVPRSYFTFNSAAEDRYSGLLSYRRRQSADVLGERV